MEGQINENHKAEYLVKDMVHICAYIYLNIIARPFGNMAIQFSISLLNTTSSVKTITNLKVSLHYF